MAQAQRLSWAVYGVGVIWLFLFPAVTISTGEGKPRGTYFDENALLVHHTRGTASAAALQRAHPHALLSRAATALAVPPPPPPISTPNNNTGPPTSAGAAWLCAELHGLGLPCLLHGGGGGSGSRQGGSGGCGGGRSVYTVLVPEVAYDGSECLLLSTPAWDLLSSPRAAAAEQGGGGGGLRGAPSGGLSLALALLSELKERGAWLSFAVVVLITGVGAADAAVGDTSTASSTTGLGSYNTSAACAPDADTWPGVRAFLDDYMAGEAPFSNNVPGNPERSPEPVRRAGWPRAALSLDFSAAGASGGGWGGVRVLTAGAAGALPNMDLPNVAFMHFGGSGGGGGRAAADSCSRAAAAVALRHRSQEQSPGKVQEQSSATGGGEGACEDAFARAHVVVQRAVAGGGEAVEAYVERLFMMLGGMAAAALGPTGPHAHFLRYSIDAITIQGLSPPRPTARPSANSLTYERAVSGLLSTIRALSNLEEDLHHSHFYYYLMGPKYFVSLGEYAYPLAAVLLPAFVRAVALLPAAAAAPAAAIATAAAVLAYGAAAAAVAVHTVPVAAAGAAAAAQWGCALVLILLLGYGWAVVALWAAHCWSSATPSHEHGSSACGSAWEPAAAVAAPSVESAPLLAPAAAGSSSGGGGVPQPPSPSARVHSSAAAATALQKAGGGIATDGSEVFAGRESDSEALWSGLAAAACLWTVYASIVAGFMCWPLAYAHALAVVPAAATVRPWRLRTRTSAQTNSDVGSGSGSSGIRKGTTSGSGGAGGGGSGCSSGSCASDGAVCRGGGGDSRRVRVLQWCCMGMGLLASAPVLAPLWLGLVVVGRPHFTAGAAVLARSARWLPLGGGQELAMLCLVALPVHLLATLALCCGTGRADTAAVCLAPARKRRSAAPVGR